jgi:MFS family permease
MTDRDRQMFLINLAHTFTHYSLLILPTAVLAMARPGGAFGAEYGPILALATGMFVLYGLFSLPQGWLAERIGRKALMSLFFVGTGGSMLACGLVSTPLALTLALAGVGLFTAIYHPIGTALLVEVAGDKPGRAIGVNGVYGNVGVALAPVVTAFMADQAGWRASFLLPGMLCLFLGLFWLRMPAIDLTQHRSARPFPEIPRFLVRRALIVLLVIATVSGLVFNAFTLLLPKLMQERLAADQALLPLVGAAAFAATLCGAVTQFSLGRLIDHRTLKSVLIPVSVILCPALALLSVLEGWVVVPLAGAVAASLFGQVTVNETMAARYIAPELRTKIYAIRFFVGFLGAAAAAPLVGFLHERTGDLFAATALLAVCSVVTLICSLSFPNREEELRPERWAHAAAE